MTDFTFQALFIDYVTMSEKKTLDKIANANGQTTKYLLNSLWEIYI